MKQFKLICMNCLNDILLDGNKYKLIDDDYFNILQTGFIGIKIYCEKCNNETIIYPK